MICRSTTLDDLYRCLNCTWDGQSRTFARICPEHMAAMTAPRPARHVEYIPEGEPLPAQQHITGLVTPPLPLAPPTIVPLSDDLEL